MQARGANPVLGDLLQSASGSDAAAAADGAIHAAAEHGPRVRDTRRGGDRRPFVAAAEGQTVPDLHVRDLGAGAGADCGRREAPLNPIEIVSWRPAHEKRVLDLASSGVRVVVVRPGIVYGGSRGIVGDVVKDAANSLVRIIGSGDNHWPLIYDRDLGELYARLVNTPDASGVYHATDGGAETVNEIVAALAEHAPTVPSIRHVPLPEARKKMGP